MENAQTLIPPPQGDVRPNLQTNMGLEKNNHLYSAFTCTLDYLIPSHLELGKTYSDQDNKKWLSFVAEACEIHPFLRKYEDAWPLKAYSQKFLGKYKARSIRRSRGCNSHPKAIGPCNRSQCVPYSDLYKGGLSSRTIINESDRTICPDWGAATFRDFLRGLQLRMDVKELQLSLQRSGVTNKDQLFEVLSWPDNQQRLFFQVDVQLSTFEYRSLVQKLRSKLATLQG